MKAKLSIILVLILFLVSAGQAQGKKKVFFLHGKPSHGYMCHEHRAGNILAAKRLNESGFVDAQELEKTGCSSDSKVLEAADTIVVFCTGHHGHILNSILWTTGVDVPELGLVSKRPDDDESHLDKSKKKIKNNKPFLL